MSSFVIIHTLSSLLTTLLSFVIVPQHAARCRDTWLGPAILHLSWSKGRRAVAIIAAAVGADADADADADANADADADADANAGVVVVVVLPVIPPPVAAVEGVDRLRCATTIPTRPGIVSS